MDPTKHYLYAFDFDHTIIDENSDTAITDLLMTPIPRAITKFYNGSNWTAYMDKIMEHLASQGVKPEAIYKRVQQLEFLPGELYKILQNFPSKIKMK